MNQRRLVFSPMKQSVKLVFIVLVLMAVAVTLSFRVSICRGFSSVQLDNAVAAAGKLELNNDDLAVSPGKQGVMAVHNETLLELATIDVTEADVKKEIDQLMDGSFWSRRRRPFLGSGRYVRLDVQARSPPEYYRLWLDIRRNLHKWYDQNKGLQPDIMSELVSQVKIPIDRHNGLAGSETTNKYSSCAVVGNSGILLKAEHGKLIDSHEAVFRLNNALTVGYERNVGSRTTLSFVNSNILSECAGKEGCFCHPYGESVPMIMYICQPVHFLDYTVCNSSHKSPLLVTDIRFDALCRRLVKYYSMRRYVEVLRMPVEGWFPYHDGPWFHYSSGMQAVMLALGICDRVSLFGFGKSDSTKHHYHTSQKAELRAHDYEAEYDLYRDLVDRRQQAIPFISEKFKFPPLVIYHQ